MTRRSLSALALAGALIVLALVFSSQRKTPDGPGGTLALRRFLASMGLQVREDPVPPGPPGTFVLLSDLRDESEERDLLAWADRGGRLVVTDPRSAIVEMLGAHLEGPIGLVGTSSLAPGCLGPESAGVGRIAARASDRALSTTVAGHMSCFPAGRGDFAIIVPRGGGTVVLMGGSTPLTNELLRSADDAVFAAGLVGNGPDVVFGPPVPPSAGAERQRSVWSLLPSRAKAALVGVCLFAVAFALVRARRLGRPIGDALIAPIPGSELVRARAGLYRRARAVAHSGHVLRGAIGDALARRLGLPRGTPADQLPRAVSESTGVPEERLARVLGGPDPATDYDLIALGREIEDLRRTVEGARR
jgi:hypothetical protein